MYRRSRVFVALLLALAISVRPAPSSAAPPESPDDPWSASPGSGTEPLKIALPKESPIEPSLPPIPALPPLKNDEPAPFAGPALPPPDPGKLAPMYEPTSTDVPGQIPAIPGQRTEPDATSPRDPSRFVRSAITTVLTPPPEQSVFPNDVLPPPKNCACDACDPTAPELISPHGLRRDWPEAWGLIGIRVVYSGDRMAPDGVPFNPLFDVDGELYVGLLPHKQLYVFGLTDFWGQKAGTNITNPHQGQFDFSKREWDFTVGAAWNYYSTLEFRVFGYAMNNLNRGTSLAYPIGFNDGVGLENRWYLPSAGVDMYDVGRLSFLSIGWLPSNTLTGGDGKTFKPGLFARSYLTWDVPIIRSYLFFDGIYEAQQSIKARLLLYDTGLAVRPWLSLQNLEFRVGVSGMYDVEVHNSFSQGYVGMRVQY